MGKDLVLLLFETALKPELSRAVSNKRRTRSLTDLSFLSASALCLRFSTMLVGVDLKVLLGCHVAHGGGVAESLGLHDPLHVGGPAVLGGDDAAGRAHQSAGDDDLLNLLVKNVLHDLAQRFELLLVSFSLLLFLLILGKFKTFLGDRDKVLSVKLLQLLHDILIDGLSHVDNLESSLLQSLNEGGGSNNLFTLTSNVVDVLLVFLHSRDVISH